MRHDLKWPWIKTEEMEKKKKDKQTVRVGFFHGNGFEINDVKIYLFVLRLKKK